MSLVHADRPEAVRQWVGQKLIWLGQVVVASYLEPIQIYSARQACLSGHELPCKLLHEVLYPLRLQLGN
jgi:hypothetical protein